MICAKLCDLIQVSDKRTKIEFEVCSFDKLSSFKKIVFKTGIFEAKATVSAEEEENNE